ncbi:MAG: integrase [Crocinitomicaceae bacterium]|nr:integrase [Crocinitomicaceae bacterium]|tara:strand:+ start:17243 stop:18133 length:891 start_codon:yes stop_codon:yes gene_type:complete
MVPLFFVKNFLDYLIAEKRFSKHTILAYSNDLSQFLDFVDIKSQHDLKEIHSRIIRSWVVFLIDNGMESSSVNRKLSTVSTFFKWLIREGITDSNPMQKVIGPKNNKRLPSFAQQSEVDFINTKNIFTDDFEGFRDLLMFEILYQTGIRSSELINLLDSKVFDNQIAVLGKRNKERIIPISQDLSSLINFYREKRKEIDVSPYYFFLLKSSKKLYPKFVYRKINSYLGKVTGLEKKSPHVLRHTFATHMLNNGASLEVLKEILGHSSLAATQVYTHNSFSQLTEIYSQSHPRGDKK